MLCDGYSIVPTHSVLLSFVQSAHIYLCAPTPLMMMDCTLSWLRTARNIGNTLAHCNWHTLHEMLFAHCKRTLQKIMGTHLPSSSQSKFSQCFHRDYFQESSQPLIPCMMLFKNYQSRFVCHLKRKRLLRKIVD